MPCPLRATAALPLVLLLTVACRGAADSAAPAADWTPDGCDPMIPDICALPFPSTALMAQTDATPSGWTLALQETSFPANIDGAPLVPTYWNERDGFSTWGPLVLWLGPLDRATLPSPHADLLGNAQIYILNAETGERVPAWAELDETSDDDARRALLIRLAQPMDHATRYVVGVRGLLTPEGALAPAPTPFAEVRDAGTGPRADYYAADIFPVLERAGVPQSELQLAWDFVTISEESKLGRARWMATDAATFSPTYTITSVETQDCAAAGVTIGRSVEGTVTAPLYTEFDAEGALLTRDADGMPYRNGEATVEFLARIPCSRLAAGTPGPIVQFGHGLLGERTEIEQAYLGQMQDDLGWTLIAADWSGMSYRDRDDIVLMINGDLSNFAFLPERVQQAYVEFDTLLRAARTILPEDAAFQAEDGTPLLDGEQFGFYGISQGGILGLGYLGFSTQLTRGALSVPGGPFTTLMPRSALFGPFLAIFPGSYPDPLEAVLMQSLLQTLWDAGEGAGWAQTMTDSVLIQTGTGDAQVTPLGAQNLARALGATLVTPALREVWGLTGQPDGFSGSAYVEWEYVDAPTEPDAGEPPPLATDTHNCVRREPEAQLQIRDFIEQGVLHHTCGDAHCQSVVLGNCDSDSLGR